MIKTCFKLTKKICFSGKLTVFTVLCERYQTIIKRDPTYVEYLDKIAQIFFGVPPPRQKKQGMFGKKKLHYLELL